MQTADTPGNEYRSRMKALAKQQRKSEMENYLLRFVESLPSFHDEKEMNADLFPVINDINSLRILNQGKPTASIQLDLNYKTGNYCGLAFHEVPIEDCNDLSMQRPFSNCDTIAGNSKPFLPGGMTEYGGNLLKNPVRSDLPCPPGCVSGFDFPCDVELPSCSNEFIQRAIEQARLIEAKVVTNHSAAVEHIESSAEEAKDNGESLFANLPSIELTSRSDASERNLEWSTRVDITKPFTSFSSKVPQMAHSYPFELDAFQKYAVYRLERSECVFVAAHTSAGKTVVAEYAIALCKKHLTRAIYTSPIKALSNQKFRDFKTTFGDVGLITGDVQLHPDAFCLIMTTEILRSMLYNGSDVVREVEWVIFDEVHYINDASRGHVWEEVLIMLPAHVNIIMLSATVPNAMEFADWVGRIKQKPFYVISTLQRPVPLQHYLYTGIDDKSKDERFLLINKEGKFAAAAITSAAAAVKKRKAPPKHDPKADRRAWGTLVKHLMAHDQLPVVVFTFSRRKCDKNAALLGGINLNDECDMEEIDDFFMKCISRLKPTDRKLPQVLFMKSLCVRGFAVHHSGVLPLLKEIVELLFQRGFVKVLFATETFAMGVNMPARSVVFDSMRKHDGCGFRDLQPGKTTKLQSQFRVTYSMILNLLQVESLRVEDMLERSFVENNAFRDLAKQKTQMQRLRKLLDDRSKNSMIDRCKVCGNVLVELYCTAMAALETYRELGRVTLNAASLLVPGRIAYMQYRKTLHSPVVLLKYQAKSQSCTVLVPFGYSDETKTASDSEVALESLLLKKSEIDISSDKFAIVELALSRLSGLSNYILSRSKCDVQSLLEEGERRMQPRYRHSKPSDAVVTCLAELKQLFGAGLVKHLTAGDVENPSDVLVLLSKRVAGFTLHVPECSDFEAHYRFHAETENMKTDLTRIELQLGQSKLLLDPVFKQKLKVLIHLGYVGEQTNVLTIKGKVAAGVHNQELFVTELLLENILSELSRAEIAAALSCTTCQAKGNRLDDMAAKGGEDGGRGNLDRIKKTIEGVINRIATIERHYEVYGEEEWEKELNFTLMEVVYAWAQGVPFNRIMTLTDVQEGLVVRCIQRLDEMIRDVRGAAVVVGDQTLKQKMEDTSEVIKRDIVFATSLYTIDTKL